jgi:hypothetical protein
MQTVRAAWALAPALLLAAGLLAPASAFAAPSPALQDGVLIDAGRGVAYVMSPKGGIDALDLTTGNVRWSTVAAVKPLLLLDGALLAQAAPGKGGQLAVVALDPARGTAQQTVAVPLPSGVRAQIFDGPSTRFRAVARMAEGGAVTVAWSASDGPPVIQGILPPENDGRQAPGSGATAATTTTAAVKAAASGSPVQRGAVRLDLAAGRVQELSSEAAAEAGSASAPAGKAADLHRALSSLDGGFVLTSERLTEGPGRRFRWTVADAGGTVVGTFEAPVARAPFVVAGSHLLYVSQPGARRVGDKMVSEPLRLQAVDLRSGAVVWSTALVDTTFRGPFAP